MSWEATQWANKQRLRLPQEQLLLLLIANAADPDGVAFRWWRKREHWWTYLVAHSRQSRASVFRHLNTLEEVGLAQREATVADDGEKRFFIHLKLDVLVDVEAADPEPGEPESHGETQNQSHGETEPVAPVRLSQSHSCDYIESLNQNPIERETRARGENRIPVRRFLLKWPTAAVDDKTKIMKAWDGLPDDEVEPALDGIDPFLAELKQHGRRHVPAGWKYLEEKSWKFIKASTSAEPKYVAFDCWSKEWWAVLFARIRRRAPLGFFVKYACEPGKRQSSEKLEDMPDSEMIATLKGFPSDGDAFEAWRPWLEAHGVKLPIWRERFWVFLPDAKPPESQSKTLCTEDDMNHKL